MVSVSQNRTVLLGAEFKFYHFQVRFTRQKKQTNRLETLNLASKMFSLEKWNTERFI